MKAWMDEMGITWEIVFYAVAAAVAVCALAWLLSVALGPV